jgi:hypothetical protein
VDRAERCANHRTVPINALGLSIATDPVPAGQAQSSPVERIIAQVDAKGVVVQPTVPSPA